MPIFEELGITEEIEQHGFVVKKGGTLVWGRDREPWSFSFTEAGPWVHAFQVVRSELDTILLNTARRYGATVWEETHVTDFLFEQERGCGLKYVTNSSSQTETVSARFLVDASGQSALLARKKAFLEWDDDLKNVAIWAYYQGGKNLDGQLAGNILIENLPDGWLWVIPLHDGTHSVGLVTPASRVSGRQALEEQLERMLANSTESKKLLASAQRVSQYRTARDWSYRSKSFAGPGFLLTGDAAGFVDPLFSTGVFLALRGAGLAAEAIDGVLKEPEKESELLRCYEQSYLDFFDVVISFVRYFYDASKDREAYWGRAQQLIDPFKHMNARQDFVHLISGLVGRGYVGEPDPSSLENGKPESSEE